MATEYINEHELALMLSIGRNCKNFGEPVRELSQESREIFDKSYAAYKAAMIESKGDKRNPDVQQHFKLALEHSQFVEPTEKEIARIYELLVILSRRCLRTFGRNSVLGEDELGSLAFERWARYRENFNPLKKSQISGVRVNAFAYMTQVIKNIIFEAYHKSNKESSTEDLHPAVLDDIPDDDEIPELEECRDMLLKESLRCTELSSCLLKIAEKYEINPQVIIKTILFYDLRPELEKNILQNKWAF